MGSVALGAIFGCQMRFLLLSPHLDRPHFLMTLLETKLVSRGVEQILNLAFMWLVTGQAFTLGSRLMSIFPGRHRFLIMALIAQQDLRTLPDL